MSLSAPDVAWKDFFALIAATRRGGGATAAGGAGAGVPLSGSATCPSFHGMTIRDFPSGASACASRRRCSASIFSGSPSTPYFFSYASTKALSSTVVLPYWIDHALTIS